MNTLVLKFDTAGIGHRLFTEAVDLSSLGALEIVRASSIEFDNTAQEWRVTVRFPDPTMAKPAHDCRWTNPLTSPGRSHGSAN
jgi:hypothetical protein